MTMCDALREYGTHADYFAWGLFFVLGFWKLVDIGRAIERWINRIKL